MVQTAVTTQNAVATSAVLYIGSLQLLLPQSEIRTLESASDVDVSSPSSGSVGWINFMRQRWPVYGLNEQLQLQTEIAPERRTCVLFALEHGYASLLCDDVVIMKQVGGVPQPLPVVMRVKHTPIYALQVQDGKLLCISNAQRLSAYLDHLMLEGVDET